MQDRATNPSSKKTEGVTGTVAFLLASAAYPVWGPVAWARARSARQAHSKAHAAAVEAAKKTDRFLEPDAVMRKVRTHQGYLVVEDVRAAGHAHLTVWWVDGDCVKDQPATRPEDLPKSSRAFLTDSRVLEFICEWFDDIEFGVAKVEVPLVLWQHGKVARVLRPAMQSESGKNS